jgi:hypothetical protein
MRQKHKNQKQFANAGITNNGKHFEVKILIARWR